MKYTMFRYRPKLSNDALIAKIGATKTKKTLVYLLCCSFSSFSFCLTDRGAGVRPSGKLKTDDRDENEKAMSTKMTMLEIETTFL